MKLTRILALLITLVVAIVCIPVGFAEENPEEYHITMYCEGRSSPYSSTADTIIGQIIKEKFNIVLDFEVMGQDWNEFVNQRLVSQDFPEIALLRWDFAGSNWVNGGGALELDELFANAENIKTLNKSRIPLWRMDDPTGQNRLLKWTYAGGLDEAMGPRNDVMVRADVLKALGYPKLRTLSDYIDFLKKAVEMFPTDHEGNQTIGMCVPFAEAWGVNLVNIIAEKGSFTGCTLFPTMYNCAEDTFVDILEIPSVKEAYQFFNTLYREGLLDGEVFTTTCTEIAEKMNTAQPICVWYPSWMATSINRNLTANGWEESSYIAMPVQADSQVENGELRYLGIWQGNSSYSLTITPAAKHPERIVELMDYLASPEGLSLVTWGIEGVHYTWEDGVKTPTPEFVEMYKAGEDEYYQIGLGDFDMLGIPDGLNPYDGEPVHITGAQAFTQELYNDAIRETLAAYGIDLEEQIWNTEKGGWIESTHVNLTVQPSAQVFDPDSTEAMVSEQLLQNRNNYMSTLITAVDDAAFEAAWEQCLADHKALNPEICTNYVLERYAKLTAEYEAAIAAAE
ncbi:MAG: hypothetical protein PUD50_10090 [Eubacteriales bacterium]|nr:hypothetical protein [Eubacteriales bacterium]